MIQWKSKLLLFCLASCLVGSGCASRQNRAIRETDYHEIIRVACVGDSITRGAVLDHPEKDSYPAVLGRLLGQRFLVGNFGVDGATLLRRGDYPYWQRPQFQQVGKFAPHVIVILLGANDSKPNNWQPHGPEFADDLGAMVDHFAALPTRPRIWLCLPAPAYGNRWDINEAAIRDGIIPAIKKVAREKNLPLIDLHTALNGHPELFPDTIHPNANGAALIARIVCEALTGRSINRVIHQPSSRYVVSGFDKKTPRFNEIHAGSESSARDSAGVTLTISMPGMPSPQISIQDVQILKCGNCCS